jgi:hypothetical protein
VCLFKVAVPGFVILLKLSVIGVFYYILLGNLPIQTGDLFFIADVSSNGNDFAVNNLILAVSLSNKLKLLFGAADIDLCSSKSLCDHH